MKLGRNQYLLSSKEFSQIGYCDVFTKSGYILYLGEDCIYYHSESAYITATLVGYAVDSIGNQDNATLVTGLVSEISKTHSSVEMITQSWGGRWTLFINQGDELSVYQDACGLKQAFFYNDNNIFIVASQSRYIAQMIDEEQDEEGKAFIETAKKLSREYSTLLKGTIYKNIYRLLPNHKLSSVNGVSRVKIDCESSEGTLTAERFYKLIHTQAKEIVKLGPVAASLTAGLDSRLVLSAFKDQNVPFVTLQYKNMPDDHYDITTAKGLCEFLGLKHEVLQCENVDMIFEEAYHEHAENAHEYWMQMAEAVSNSKYKDVIWVKGSCCEIVRNSFGIIPDWLIDAKLLCKLYDIPESKYAYNLIDNWITDTKPYAKASKMALLDLFYWEYRMGCWLAECLNEYDVVGETFTPFNVRRIIHQLNGIAKNLRTSPSYVFFSSYLRDRGLITSFLTINPGRYLCLKSSIKVLIKNRLPFLYVLMVKAKKNVG